MTIALTIHLAAALAGVGIAVAVLLPDRRSVAKWMFAAGMAILAMESYCSGRAASAAQLEAPDEVLYWENWRLFATALLPGIWLAFSLTFARGDYRGSLHRWQWVLAVTFAIPPLLALAFAGDLMGERMVANGHWVYPWRIPAKALNLIMVIGAVMVLMNLERTYRASVGTMRWRIKYMILGLSILFSVRIYTGSQAVLANSALLSLQTISSGAIIFACALIFRSLRRSGQFDTAVYPSQSVLQHSLTVFLAGIYLFLVGVAAKLAAYVGGDTGTAIRGIVILAALVLLTMLLVSDRVRMQTRRFVSRHFQRPFHDYRTVWRAFTEGTASRVEPEALCQAVVKLVAQFFQVLSVTIWMVEGQDEQLAFAASSSLSLTQSDDLLPNSAEMAAIIAALRLQPDPVDVDESKQPWAEPLRNLHPAEFRRGGHRVCVPMIAGGQLQGIMMLGDRVGGLPFSSQDFDLLRCVGDQVAAGLLNIRLSRRLVEAKEMEAFQTMSAFFVHDLKNTASTLSLTLQNLPIHYNDPAFREDALRGIAKSARHIDDLISRLSQLRHRTAVGPVEADLNRVVTDVLGGLDLSSSVKVTQELAPLPRQPLDPEQIQKVVTNLVLNAREAVKGDGQIHIRTLQQNGWAVLSVADNGIGMSREFVEKSLFRPFQTTKKQGIGIGMFQSKMIIDAHRGKIEVETAPGKGTTFRVLLPLKVDQK